MSRQFLGCAVVACVLTFGAAGPIRAQSTATDDAKKAGQATEQAGKDAGQAGKNAGKAVAKGAKKTAKKVKKAVTPDTTTAVCKDGTTQSGKTKTTACDGHGGVQ